MKQDSTSNLDFKIPPLLLVCAWALIMWALSTLIPMGSLAYKYNIAVFGIFFTLGFIALISGVLHFGKVGTTVNPTAPAKSRTLVTFGIYRITRNPMYLGLLLMLVGWGIYLSNSISLFSLVGFVAYMNKFQITPEERILRGKFGQEYESYTKQTRRWI